MAAVLFLSNRATDEGSRFNDVGGIDGRLCATFLTFELPNVSGRGGRLEGLKLAPDMSLMCSTSLMWYCRSVEWSTGL